MYYYVDFKLKLVTGNFIGHQNVLNFIQSWGKLTAFGGGGGGSWSPLWRKGEGAFPVAPLPPGLGFGLSCVCSCCLIYSTSAMLVYHLLWSVMSVLHAWMAMPIILGDSNVLCTCCCGCGSVD